MPIKLSYGEDLPMGCYIKIPESGFYTHAVTMVGKTGYFRKIDKDLVDCKHLVDLRGNEYVLHLSSYRHYVIFKKLLRDAASHFDLHVDASKFTLNFSTIYHTANKQEPKKVPYEKPSKYQIRHSVLTWCHGVSLVGKMIQFHEDIPEWVSDEDHVGKYLISEDIDSPQRNLYVDMNIPDNIISALGIGFKLNTVIIVPVPNLLGFLIAVRTIVYMCECDSNENKITN